MYPRSRIFLSQALSLAPSKTGLAATGDQATRSFGKSSARAGPTASVRMRKTERLRYFGDMRSTPPVRGERFSTPLRIILDCVAAKKPSGIDPPRRHSDRMHHGILGAS